MNIQFKLIRNPQSKRTKGVLFFNNKTLCDTLEDRVRDINADGDLLDKGEEKIYGETAVPYGTYELDVTYSPKFKREMTLVKNVPHFTGIRIHWGRTIKQSLGCILVGRSRGNTLDNTGMTNKITEIVRSFKNKGKRVFIEIT